MVTSRRSCRGNRLRPSPLPRRVWHGVREQRGEAVARAPAPPARRGRPGRWRADPPTVRSACPNSGSGRRRCRPSPTRATVSIRTSGNATRNGSTQARASTRLLDCCRPPVRYPLTSLRVRRGRLAAPGGMSRSRRPTSAPEAPPLPHVEVRAGLVIPVRAPAASPAETARVSASVNGSATLLGQRENMFGRPVQPDPTSWHISWEFAENAMCH